MALTDTAIRLAHSGSAPPASQVFAVARLRDLRCRWIWSATPQNQVEDTPPK